MRKTTKFAIAAVATLAIAAVVTGCHHRRGHNPQRVRKFTIYIVDDVLDDLDATDAQATRIQALRAEVVDDVLSQRKAHKQAGNALLAELAKAQPDAKAVHALIDARARALTEVAHRTADALLKSHAVLTPKQRSKLLDEINNRRSRR